VAPSKTKHLETVAALIGALVLAAWPTCAPATSAQEARARVIVVRSYVWAGEPGHLARAPELRALVRETDGAWAECAHVTGVASEGTIDASVARSRSAGPEAHRVARAVPGLDVDCALSDIAPAQADAVALLGGVPAHFGPFTLGVERDETAAVLGVEPATLPERTDARTIVRHGPYRLVFRNGWLMVVAAFLDELPGVAASGAPTIAPSAPFDEVVGRLGLAARARGRIGRPDLFEPDVPHADAARLSRSRLRMGHAVGAIELDGRVLLYASYLQHESDLLARLRSLVLHHALTARSE
jgi:hypothetical protein